MKRYPILSMFLILAASMLACNAGSGTSVPPSMQPSVPPVGNTPLPVTPTLTPATPYISAPGVSAITLLTVADGSGPKPLFEWTPVDEAVRYQLFVYDSTGTPYWAWEGAQTKIYLGGSDEQPPADSEGPVLEGTASWVVFAYNTQGKLIASSPVQTLNP